MSHTYTQTVIHVVFSTKDRRKLMSGVFSPTNAGLRSGYLQEARHSCSRRGRDGRSHSSPHSDSSNLSVCRFSSAGGAA